METYFKRKFKEMSNSPWKINQNDSPEILFWKRECRLYQSLFWLALMTGFFAGFLSTFIG